MNDRNLIGALRAIHEFQVRRAPKQHPLRKSECLPLARFADSERENWSEAEEQHATHCPYCQRVIALMWRSQCPVRMTLLRYRAGILRDADAMRIHLEEDKCPRCVPIARCALLTGLAGLVRGGRRTLEQVRQIIAGAALASGGLAYEATLSEETHAPFRLRTVSEDGSLIATLWETDRGLLEPEKVLLVLDVESPDPANAGRGVRVELLGMGDPLTFDLVLKEAKAGCVARRALGEISAYEKFLANCALVAAWAEAYDSPQADGDRAKEQG